jgi:NADPH-dependent 2,4-dienoyl-CoA reductase/sulfur reductase-like enzyme/rhodanese-related sulfurtransferase
MRKVIMGRKIVIIGGIATGPKAAARARRLDSEAEITIVERGGLFSYAGCGMPFYIEGVIEGLPSLLCTPRGVIRNDAYFEIEKDIEAHCWTEATKINSDEKTITVRDVNSGEEHDKPYDKLVLAVGASPIVPRMEGSELEGVHRLYTPLDADAIRKELEAGKTRVAIIGGGLIGMEVCGAFVSRGCQVTVLEMMDRIVPGLLDEDVSLLLEQYLRDNGVDVRKGSRVVRILDDGSGRVAGVETEDGLRVEVDLVVMAIGVSPNVELAKAAGLEIGETGAIAVNEFLQTSDPDIYAGGDCVENTCMITGRKIYAPLGSTANKHGRVIGDNVTGGSTEFPGVTSTTVFKVLDYNIGTTGLSSREAEKLGYDVVASVAPRGEYAHYYPDSKSIIIKMIADRETSKLLGAQVIGPGEGVKRIDVAASVLRFGGGVKDVADLDLGYAPPFSTAIDPLAHAANIVRNKIEGLAHGISSTELRSKLESRGDFILLDVRTKGEVETEPFDDPRVVHIPVQDLRRRHDELPKDREIITFCRTSVRAYGAERILSGRGFNDVKFLDGSLKAWPFDT